MKRGLLIRCMSVYLHFGDGALSVSFKKLHILKLLVKTGKFSDFMIPTFEKS